MEPLEVHLLGAFELSYMQKSINLSSRPAQSLFAYLVLNAGTAQRREKLAGLLWPDSLEETARDNLRHALWRTRKALESVGCGGYLNADDLIIKFEVDTNLWLDVAELEKINKNASSDELMAALTSYRGELLPGFYDEWVVLERDHIYSVYEHHMARLMALLLAENRWLDILDWGERWIKQGQNPEPAYRALMWAHAAKGDMPKVASIYQRCVKALKDFEIEPSEQTRDLFEKLKSKKENLGEPDLIPAEKKASLDARTSNLPRPLTSFIGREEELKKIAETLAVSRLLTLTGSGGVGKTRLAIETANGSSDLFKDGVFWVSLGGLSDPHLLHQQIAQAMHIREYSNFPLIETLKTELVDKSILLVMDNCEHLVEAAAQFAEQLLGACPNIKILATSREKLGTFAETTWHVPSLSETTSRRLFKERAQSIQPDFAASPSSEQWITQICTRLDGIPLAIELAAARSALLSLDEVAKRLDDRFSLLTSGNRTALPRQQTLRATIDWSYDLLTEAERILFRRLAVFPGGFSLEAVEKICSQGVVNQRDILDLVGRLSDKSLVVVEKFLHPGETRYGLLESVRYYAIEKLAESTENIEIRDQFLQYFVEMVEMAEPHNHDREANSWHQRIHSDFDNIRSALDWASTRKKAEASLRMLGSLSQYWLTHGRPFSEWHRRAEAALSSPEGFAHTSARAKTLNGMGFLNWGDMEKVDRRPQLEEALSIGLELGDQYNIATSLFYLGMTASERGDCAEAHRRLEESFEMWKQLGPKYKSETGWTMIFLGDVAFSESDMETAGSYYQIAASLLSEIENKNILANPLRRLGQIAWRRGDHESAKRFCLKSLYLNRETDDPRAIIACMAGFANIAVVEGKMEQAATLIAAVDGLLASSHLRLLRLDQIDYENCLVLIKDRMDSESLQQIWSRGKALSFDEALAYTLQKNEPSAINSNS
ncbi:MAG TPA: BTAD domain-containing putative transcriptional regulator [Anaerolineales bacterium]|jgi:predicted ATPase/DNA-binding SARP family transcriptional activator